MTAPNAELAYRVVDHIDAHPELWNQGVYIGKAECGTVACFAGWAVLLAGGEIDTSTEGVTIVGRPDIAAGVHIERAAISLLGIQGEDVALYGDPFDGLLTRGELGERVEAIFGPRPASVLAAADCSHRDDPGHDHDDCLDLIAGHPEYIDPRPAVTE